ncbi:MAG: substrate-binding domain-containing protein [Akkermansiaceae bacterium]|nr:substrate-binding domain-containing protein [Akkermansiaceae bacterium]
MKKHKRILIVLGFMNPGILAGFSRYAREADWVLNAFSVFHGAVPTAWKAHGLLTTNVFRPDLAEFVRETSQQIPTVLHGCDDLNLGVSKVECDEYEIGRMAAKHLLDQDHKHFAAFRYSRNTHAMRRLAGFQDELKKAGHECVDWEILEEHGRGSGQWLHKKLAHLPRPLGLFAEDDLLAARVIDAATDAGWQVPQDLAVVGCGNIGFICEFGMVPITSIDLPVEEMAYQAAAMLGREMSEKKREPQTLVLPPSGLIARESTNSVAASMDLVKRAIARMEDQQRDPALDASAVADYCGVSLRLLYRDFKKDLRTTPMACLLRIRLRRAKDLLTQDGLNIEEVAEACGFPSLRTFQRAFQRVEGDSPLRWKQANKR